MTFALSDVSVSLLGSADPSLMEKDSEIITEFEEQQQKVRNSGKMAIPTNDWLFLFQTWKIKRTKAFLIKGINGAKWYVLVNLFTHIYDIASSLDHL